ncbi:UNVERIFIED_CONTAM: hypothetical protein K2H54_038873 [Gekko kuhli]
MEALCLQIVAKGSCVGSAEHQLDSNPVTPASQNRKKMKPQPGKTRWISNSAPNIFVVLRNSTIGFSEHLGISDDNGQRFKIMFFKGLARGKVVIVTGGTSGIGLATVREFVRHGANVVFCSRSNDAEKGQAIQRDLKASGCPGDAFYQVCDVRRESDIKRLIRVTLERYGCLDCLVNNAGNIYLESLDDVTPQDFENIMQLNVVSCLLLSKYALPYLRQTKGNIINMGSIEGVIGMKNALSAAASKGALIAMTKALAIDESKYGVRVNR